MRKILSSPIQIQSILKYPKKKCKKANKNKQVFVMTSLDLLFSKANRKR